MSKKTKKILSIVGAIIIGLAVVTFIAAVL